MNKLLEGALIHWIEEMAQGDPGALRRAAAIVTLRVAALDGQFAAAPAITKDAISRIRLRLVDDGEGHLVAQAFDYRAVAFFTKEDGS